MRLLIYIGALFAVVFHTSCSRYISIERSERFVSEKTIDNAIICIDPQVKFIEDNVAKKTDEITALEEHLRSEIDYSARDNGIDLKIMKLNPEAGAGYYQDLLALKKELLQANNYQNTPLNFSKSPGFNSISKSVFVYPPLIAHDFTGLSKTYGTPYYSFIGIYKNQGKLIYYHLIVNTNTAETVYRELKTIPKSKIKKKFISQMVYDSMAMLKKEFE